MAQVLAAMRAAPMDIPLDVPTRRETLDAFMAGPLVDGTVEVATTLGGRPAVWIAATGRRTEPGAGPVLLYLHGGAYEIGSIAAYRRFASELALLLDAAVAVVDYRLAPEHPFPAAVDDAVAAYADLLAGGYAPSAVALMGDSAGGGLTAAALVGRGAPGPAATRCRRVPLAVDRPHADGRLLRPRARATDPFLDRERLEQSAANYLAGADPRDPLASPALAPPAELRRPGAAARPVVGRRGPGRRRHRPR